MLGVTHFMIRLARWMVVCSLALVFVTGCSRSKGIGEVHPPDQMNSDEEAILHVGLAYREAATALKKAPSGVKDLKPYLKQYGDPDKVLVSPNDGQPYEIAWGMMPMRPARNAQMNPILISEKTGKDGKRYVLDFRFKIRHVTEEELDSLRGPGGNVSARQ
jgi:hypothetical protein